MKKLLILAYDFPPYVSVGGLRPWSWYKYLHRFGIYPVVITRQWSNQYGNHLDYIAPGTSDKDEIEQTPEGVIIRSPYKPNLANRILLKYGQGRFAIVRQLVTAWYEVAQYFFSVGPKSGIYRTARNYLKNNKVDAIIASGDPFILFRYAHLLSREFGIPYIADYRDAWCQVKKSGMHGLLYYFFPMFERRFVSNAAAVTTVSEYIKSLIGTNLKGKKFHIIPNGYDPEIASKVSEIRQNDKVLTIAMAGTIYPWHSWRSFLDIVEQFVSQNSGVQISLKFYGINIADEVQSYIDTKCMAIKGMVTILPRMSNSRLLAEMAAANVLLLFNYYSMMGTKIYDYLALRRRILLCYSNDPKEQKLKEKFYPMDEVEGQSRHLQQDLIEATNSGVVARDELHLMEILKSWHDEFKQKGHLECLSHGVEQFSRIRQVEKLAEVVGGLGIGDSF